LLIEILGSGGANTTPRPGCVCPVCEQARARGIPFSRSGPGYFLHGPDFLIDTSEEIKEQLNRAGVRHVKAATYSHWHPDHTAGRRVFEMNGDLRRWPPQPVPTDVYLPQQVAADARVQLGLWDQLAYMQSRGMLRLHELQDGEAIVLDGLTVRPFRLAEDYVYAFLCEEQGRRVLIAPDELHGWRPPAEVQGVDLAILPMGITEFDVFTGERLIPTQHPVLTMEATHLETLEMVRRLSASRVILSHIEEPFRLNPDDLSELGARLQDGGLPITFAYDGMRIEV
jgi:phosphoribosyl 1,2-cyclic phosphate phosphodiesterase